MTVYPPKSDDVSARSVADMDDIKKLQDVSGEIMTDDIRNTLIFLGDIGRVSGMGMMADSQRICKDRRLNILSNRIDIFLDNMVKTGFEDCANILPVLKLKVQAPLTGYNFSMWIQF